ncbi:MAG: hypothetical protein F6K30_11975 [Cyanothece sp. SIO2G6]|nr:hypothetical protein [Cyanothece sp. SIO2G6]
MFHPIVYHRSEQEERMAGWPGLDFDQTQICLNSAQGTSPPQPCPRQGYRHSPQLLN